MLTFEVIAFACHCQKDHRKQCCRQSFDSGSVVVHSHVLQFRDVFVSIYIDMVGFILHPSFYGCVNVV